MDSVPDMQSQPLMMVGLHGLVNEVIIILGCTSGIQTTNLLKSMIPLARGMALKKQPMAVL